MAMSILILSYFFNIFAAGPVLDQCPRIMTEKGLSELFPQLVAQSTQSLTVEDIQYYFESEVTEENGIPTVNVNLEGEQRILPNTPLAGLGHKEISSTTPLDRAQQYLRRKWGNSSNFSKDEVMTLALKTIEMWEEAGKQYRNVKKLLTPGSPVCSCVTDIENNGVIRHLEHLANHGLHSGVDRTAGNETMEQQGQDSGELNDTATGAELQERKKRATYPIKHYYEFAKNYKVIYQYRVSTNYHVSGSYNTFDFRKVFGNLKVSGNNNQFGIHEDSESGSGIHKVTGNNNTFNIYRISGDLEVSGNYNEFKIHELRFRVGRVRISGDYNYFNIDRVSGKLHISGNNNEFNWIDKVSGSLAILGNSNVFKYIIFSTDLGSLTILGNSNVFQYITYISERVPDRSSLTILGNSNEIKYINEVPGRIKDLGSDNTIMTPEKYNASDFTTEYNPGFTSFTLYPADRIYGPAYRGPGNTRAKTPAPASNGCKLISDSYIVLRQYSVSECVNISGSYNSFNFERVLGNLTVSGNNNSFEIYEDSRSGSVIQKVTGDNNTFDIECIYGGLEVSGNNNTLEIYEIEAPVGRLQISGDYNIFTQQNAFVSGKIYISGNYNDFRYTNLLLRGKFHLSGNYNKFWFIGVSGSLAISGNNNYLHWITRVSGSLKIFGNYNWVVYTSHPDLGNIEDFGIDNDMYIWNIYRRSLNFNLYDINLDESDVQLPKEMKEELMEERTEMNDQETTGTEKWDKLNLMSENSGAHYDLAVYMFCMLN